MPDIIQNFDESILLYISHHLHTPLLDQIMIFITSLGNSSIIWIAITFLMLLNKKTRRCGILLAISLSLEFLLCDGILKPLFSRERPFKHIQDISLLIKRPGSYSFPSGHTMAAFTAATAIVYYYKDAGIAAFALAFLIGFSRLYLFCHYPSDVLGGAIFGILLSLMVIVVYRYIISKANVKES